MYIRSINNLYDQFLFDKIIQIHLLNEKIAMGKKKATFASLYDEALSHVDTILNSATKTFIKAHLNPKAETYATLFCAKFSHGRGLNIRYTECPYEKHTLLALFYRHAPHQAENELTDLFFSLSRQDQLELLKPSRKWLCNGSDILSFSSFTNQKKWCTFLNDCSSEEIKIILSSPEKTFIALNQIAIHPEHLSSFFSALEKLDSTTLFSSFRGAAAGQHVTALEILFDKKKPPLAATALLRLLNQLNDNDLKRVLIDEEWLVNRLLSVSWLHQVFEYYPAEVTKEVLPLIKRLKAKDLGVLLSRPRGNKSKNILELANTNGHADVITWGLTHPDEEIVRLSAHVAENTLPEPTRLLHKAKPIYDTIMGTSSELSSEQIQSLQTKSQLLDTRWDKKQSLLHLACLQQKDLLTKQLLDMGADPNSQDETLKTPLEHALKTKNKKILSQLLSHNSIHFFQNNEPALNLILEVDDFEITKMACEALNRNTNPTDVACSFELALNRFIGKKYALTELDNIDSLLNTTDHSLPDALMAHAKSHQDSLYLILTSCRNLFVKEKFIKAQLELLAKTDDALLERTITFQIIMMVWEMPIGTRMAFLNKLTLASLERGALERLLAKALVKPAIYINLSQADFELIFQFFSNQTMVETIVKILLNKGDLSLIATDVLEYFSQKTELSKLNQFYGERPHPILLILVLIKTIEAQKNCEALFNEFTRILALITLQPASLKITEFEQILSLIKNEAIKQAFFQYLTTQSSASALNHFIDALFLNIEGLKLHAPSSLLRNVLILRALDPRTTTDPQYASALSDFFSKSTTDEIDAILKQKNTWLSALLAADISKPSILTNPELALFNQSLTKGILKNPDCIQLLPLLFQWQLNQGYLFDATAWLTTLSIIISNPAYEEAITTLLSQQEKIIADYEFVKPILSTLSKCAKQTISFEDLIKLLSKLNQMKMKSFVQFTREAQLHELADFIQATLAGDTEPLPYFLSGLLLQPDSSSWLQTHLDKVSLYVSNHASIACLIKGWHRQDESLNTIDQIKIEWRHAESNKPIVTAVHLMAASYLPSLTQSLNSLLSRKFALGFQAILYAAPREIQEEILRMLPG